LYARLGCGTIGNPPAAIGTEASFQVFANARAVGSIEEAEADETLELFGRLTKQTYTVAVSDRKYT
jgi:hypothetical protein